MKLDEIKTIEDLKEHLKESDTRLVDVETRSRVLQEKIDNYRSIVKSGLLNGGVDKPDVKTAYETMGALMVTAAGKSTDRSKAILDDMQGKATTGTPLVIDSTTGSYLIPEEYISEVFAVLTEQSEIYPLLTKRPMTSNSAKQPKKATGVSFTRVTSDSSDLTEASPTFDEIDLDVHTQALWISVTENFLEDNLVAIGMYFNDIIQEAWVESIEKNILNNASNPTGLLQTAGVNTYQMGAGSASIDSIEINDLYAMIEELTTGAKRKGARFIMNPLTFDKVRKITDASGSPLIAPWADQSSRNLFGYPTVWSDSLPSADANDTAFIAFGNPKHMTVGERLGLEIKFFGETLSAVTNSEQFFRARYRTAHAVSEPEAFSILKTAS